MKIKITLLILFCFAGIFTATSQIPNYVPQNGLVGWWPFNGNANDESGNGNNAVLQGNATFSTDRFNIVNSSYSGDVNSGADITAINNFPFGNSQRTISLWFKCDLPYASGNRELFAYGDNFAGTRFGIYMDGNSLGVEHVNGGRIFPFIPDSNWHQIIAVYPLNGGGTDSIKLYLDGLLQISSNFNPVSSLNTANSFIHWIGTLGFPPTPLYCFSGKIDDLGIWNRALSQQEITNLYTSSAPPPCNPLPGNLMSGLVGYWPFCGNANDESGNGNDGTVNGATLTADRFGNINSAYSLDGNNDYVFINHSFFDNGWADQSLSIWYCLDQIANPYNGNSSHILFNTSPHNGFALDLNWGSSNKYSMFLGNGTPSTSWNLLFNSPSNSDISLNNWKHIVVVKNGTSYKLYIDGLYDTTWTSPTPVQSYLYKMYFGAADTTVSNEVIIGKIDDIGIWNRALTQSEINQLYNQNVCFQTITVTDTLLINVHLTGLNPVTYKNTIRVFPNPTHDHITIDFGSNYTSLSGYSLRIDNTVGQTVFTSPVQQNSAYIDLNTWTGVGLYFVYLLDNQGHVVDVRKIVLQ